MPANAKSQAIIGNMAYCDVLLDPGYLCQCTDLPNSSGCDSVLLIVDPLAKQKTIQWAPVLARQLLDNILRLHGLPSEIVLDR